MEKNAIKSLTTQYNNNEDRIQLTCRFADNTVTDVWLTQRIARRLIPTLLKELNNELVKVIKEESTHSFVKFVTENNKTVQHAPAPIKVVKNNWLIQSIEITRMPLHIRITFIGEDNQRIGWVLSSGQLRQWLDILYFAYLKSEWPAEFWPDWVKFGILESDLSTMTWN